MPVSPIRVRLPARRLPVDTNGSPPAVTFQADDANTWVAALRHDHTQPFRTVAFQIARIANDRAPSSQGLWSVAILQEGLMRAVAEILSDGYICGFSLEAITRPAGREFHEQIFLPYLVSLLRISVFGLQFLKKHCKHSEHRVPRGVEGCPGCALMSTLLVPFGSGLGSFLTALWGISDPFLRRESDTKPAGLPVTLGEILSQTSVPFVQTIFAVSSKILKQKLTEQAYYGAHLMMFTWLYAKKSLDQERALYVLGSILSITFPDHANRSYVKFFQEIIDHGIASRDIYAAILAHMVEDIDARSDLEGDHYDTGISYASQIRGEYTISLSSHTEHALLWYSLSAGRRELCSAKADPGTPKDDKRHYNSLRVMNLCSYLCKIFGREALRGEDQPPYVPELWIYAVLVMFANHLFNHVQYINVTLRDSKDTLIHALHELGRSLRYYRVHPSPPHPQPWRRRPPPSLRIFALDWWIEALKELEQLPRPIDPLLETVFVVCVQVYRDLDNHHKSMLPGEVEGVQDFEPLERCAWEQCSCTVFRPLHKLKKCTGCHLVAYCNLRCQRGDWKDHKSSCKSESARRGR